MDYAYNSSGKPENAQFATRGKLYICPHCGERELILKNGNQKVSYFAHKKIPDRTPMQRTCPEYHDKNDSITNTSEKLYVINGGVPVYLKSAGDIFYIEAVFPQLTSNSISYLKDNNVQLKISMNPSPIIRNITDYISVQISDFTSKWINVTLIGDNSLNNSDLKNKWLCGIQGLNELNNTFFRHTYTGGVRLPKNSRIYVNTKYYMVCNDDFNFIKYKKNNGLYQGDGFEFNKVGIIKSNINWDSRQFWVFEFQINKFTEEAQRFITSRYYNLCSEKSELFPLWPPASIEGNQLIYSNRDNEAYFYNKSGADEKVGCDSSIYSSNGLRTQNSISSVMKLNPQSWVSLYINFHEKINATNIIERNTIQWHIATRKNMKEDFMFEYDLIDDHDEIIDSAINSSDAESVRIIGNVPCEMIVKRCEYVALRTNGEIRKNDYLDSLVVLDAFGFGKKYFDFRIGKEYIDVDSSLDFIELEKKIYFSSNSKMINVDRRIVLFYNSIPKTNKKLRRLISRWIYTGKIPYDVYRYIINGVRQNENIK